MKPCVLTPSVAWLPAGPGTWGTRCPRNQTLGGIDVVPEECREEKGLFPSPLEEGLWRLCWREEGKPCQPCVVTKSGPCGQQGHGRPGRAKEPDRGPKHEIRVHTECANQELNEDVMCSFWKLKVMQDVY